MTLAFARYVRAVYGSRLAYRAPIRTRRGVLRPLSASGWERSHHDTAPSLDDLNEEQVRLIGLRTQAMWLDHVTLKTNGFPPESFPPGGEAIGKNTVRIKRLIYRSKQRGWLEVDLLMGSWAEKHAAALTPAEMDQYEAVLNCETVDLFPLLTGALPPPPHLDTPVLAQLREWAHGRPLGLGPADYARAKADSRLT